MCRILLTGKVKGKQKFPRPLWGRIRRLGVPLSQIVLLPVTTVTSASSFPSLESLERIGFVNTFQALERTRHRLRSGLGSGRAIATSILSANRVQRSDSMRPADLGHSFVHPSCAEISGKNAFVLGAHDRGHCLLAFLPVTVDLLRGGAASGCA